MSSQGAVVMAVFRPDPLLLERQITSLRSQSVTNWRCIVGLDGPDPDSRSLLVRLTRGDDRFDIYDFDRNVGVYRHFERLLHLVPREVSWVALADQDDSWNPDKFQKLLSAFLKPDVTAVSGQARLINAEGKYLGSTRRRPGNMTETLIRNQVTGSLSIFRRDVVDRSLPFPRATSIAIHDHWMAVCAAAIGRIVLHDEPVQDYVQHGANVLGEARPTTVRGTMKEMRASGGVRHHLNVVASQRWGWRVTMACASLKLGVPKDHRTTISAISRGRLSFEVWRSMIHNVAVAGLPPKAAVGMLVSAWWWPRIAPHSLVELSVDERGSGATRNCAD